ncbi:DUF1059 domain-containing protein [Ilumatobacter sp.]|uniref:DUF1059 domain-containing protein n=1 Tax=Ilumatobacter sp. TaxID=1967498 RepID=UPI003B51FFDC
MGVNLSCGDVIPGCAAVFEAEDESALMSQVAEHARTEHGITSMDDETVGAVRSVIRRP